MVSPEPPGRGLGGLFQRLGPRLTAVAIVDLVLVLGAVTVLGFFLTGALDRSGGPSHQATNSTGTSKTTAPEEGVTSPTVPPKAAIVQVAESDMIRHTMLRLGAANSVRVSAPAGGCLLYTSDAADE